MKTSPKTRCITYIKKKKNVDNFETFTAFYIILYFYARYILLLLLEKQINQNLSTGFPSRDNNLYTHDVRRPLDTYDLVEHIRHTCARMYTLTILITPSNISSRAV